MKSTPNYKQALIISLLLLILAALTGYAATLDTATVASPVVMSEPDPLDSFSMGMPSRMGGGMSRAEVPDTGENTTTANPNPELQHYNWNANMTGGDCGYCHETSDKFLPPDYKYGPGFCASCHNAGGVGHDKSLQGKYGHSLFADTTGIGRKRPSYGNITAGENNNQPFARLKDGHLVVCVTCHNVMSKPEDPVRTWELTTTADQYAYALQYGGWSASGYAVPTVYRDTSLWTGPTYSKDKKDYIVPPSEYTYDENAGTITFVSQQDPSVYIYASLDYPYLRASSQDNRLCADCHTQPTHEGNNCLACHRAHNTYNLAGIRGAVRTPDLTERAVSFLSYTGTNSFADGDATYDGICEVCHTQTKYYRRDGSGFANHSGGFNYSGQNCTICHNHLAGYAGLGQLAVHIESPFANSTTSETSAIVSGSITGREGAEVGVTVNGMLAEVYGGEFAVSGIPLAEGANTITAVATDTYGITASDSINVTVVNPTASKVSISASPSSGSAPLAVNFTVGNSVANAALFELDFGDGSSAVEDSIDTLRQSGCQHTYSNNGIYKPTFTVYDADWNPYSKSTVVNVSQPPNLVDKWNGMRSALLTGDVNKAVSYISPTTRDSYRVNLTTLAQKEPQALQDIASDMADMQIYETGNGYALGDFRFVNNGEVISFGILFTHDEDGIWRINKF